MKYKLFIILVLLFWVPGHVKAQPATRVHSDLHNEIGISAGPISLIGTVVYGSVGFFEAIGSGISKKDMEMKLYGEYGLNYHYNVKHWCQIGVKAIVESASITHYTDTFRSAIQDKYTMALISVMPSVRFTYLNRPWVRLYSGVDLGACYLLNTSNFDSQKESQESDNKSSNFVFAFNVTPIGINVGKKFYGMVETNIGYEAFIKAGIGVRF